MNLGIDLTAALSPGVYVLRHRGRVVFVGGGRNPLARIYAHSTWRRGTPIPSWLPCAPTPFDAVELFPCTVDDLANSVAIKRMELSWSPTQPRLAAHAPT